MSESPLAGVLPVSTSLVGRGRYGGLLDPRRVDDQIGRGRIEGGDCEVGIDDGRRGGAIGCIHSDSGVPVGVEDDGDAVRRGAGAKRSTRLEGSRRSRSCRRTELRGVDQDRIVGQVGLRMDLQDGVDL